MNPARTYGILTFTISASGRNINSIVMKKDTRPNRSPLSVACFVIKDIKQSTTSASVYNWLTVSIMTHSALPPGTIIALALPTGSLTKIVPLP
jgi:hypothetical protein